MLLAGSLAQLLVLLAHHIEAIQLVAHHFHGDTHELRRTASHFAAQLCNGNTDKSKSSVGFTREIIY